MDYNDNILVDFAGMQWEKVRNYLSKDFSLGATDCEVVFHDSFAALYDFIRWGSLPLQSSLSNFFLGICKKKAHELLKKQSREVTIDDAPLDSSSDDDDAAIIAAIKNSDKDRMRTIAWNVTHNIDLATASTEPLPVPPPMPIPQTLQPAPQSPTQPWQEPESKPSNKKKVIGIVIGVAALMLFITLGLLLRKNVGNPHNISTENVVCDTPYVEPSYDEDLLYAELDTISPMGKEIYELLVNVKNEENLKSTISQLEQLWKKSQETPSNSYSAFAPQIGYTLALAYKQDNDIANAKLALRKVMSIEPEGTEYGNRARRLLEELKKMK